MGTVGDLVDLIVFIGAHMELKNRIAERAVVLELHELMLKFGFDLFEVLKLGRLILTHADSPCGSQQLQKLFTAFGRAP